MSSGFTPVNRIKRRSPTPPDITELAKQVHKLNDARRGGSLEWPAGITLSNTIIDKIKRSVPGPLANKGRPHDSDEDEFVSCAAASHWPHAKTAAYLGRSPQSVRLTLCRLKKVRDAAEGAAERTVEESTETTQGGPSRALAASDPDSAQGSSQVLVVGQTAESGRLPEPSSSSPVARPLRDSSDEQPQSSNTSIPAQSPEYFAQILASYIASRRLPEPVPSRPLGGPSWSVEQQPNGEVLLESDGQTTFEPQVVDATTDPVSVASGMRQRDRSGMNALAEAAAMHGSRLPYRNPLEVMGIVQGQAA
jgi:hypothetical protein